MMSFAQELAEKSTTDWIAGCGEGPFNHAGTEWDPHNPNDCLCCHIMRTVDEALERAAKECEDDAIPMDKGEGAASDACAARIRALSRRAREHNKTAAPKRGRSSR